MSLSLSANDQTVYLDLPTAEYIHRAEEAIDPREITPWLRRDFPGPRLLGLTLPTGFDPMPRMRLNRLFWPWGASRHSTFFALVSRDKIDAVRDLAFGTDGSKMNQLTLKMTSPGIRSLGEIIQTQMWMMPPQPIARVPDGAGGWQSGSWIIGLYDDRYYWWNVAAPALAIDGGTTTWASLFPLFATALGITITADSIPSGYRLPSTALNLANELLPPVLDAVCANVGMRLVRALDGTVRVISATTAQTLRKADDTAYPMRNLTGGGSFFLDVL